MCTERPQIDPAADPFAQLAKWLDIARNTELNDAEAMALATVGSDHLPNVRMVLLKEVDVAAGGLIFYTNYESAKGFELSQTPKAAIVLHWKSLRLQVRARGSVARVNDERAGRYYASRAYQSRIGAWASEQSRPLAGRGKLLERVARFAAKYPLNPPRPPHWGGFVIRPLEMEFWADGEFRLHDRFQWQRATVEDAEWQVQRLSP